MIYYCTPRFISNISHFSTIVWQKFGKPWLSFLWNFISLDIVPRAETVKVEKLLCCYPGAFRKLDTSLQGSIQHISKIVYNSEYNRILSEAANVERLFQYGRNLLWVCLVTSGNFLNLEMSKIFSRHSATSQKPFSLLKNLIEQCQLDWHQVWHEDARHMWSCN